MKQELIKKIQIDLEEGMTWAAIQKKYDLKSNYMIKQALGDSVKQHKDYHYMDVRFNEEELKKLNDNDLSSIAAYLHCINDIMFNKSLFNVLKMIHKELKKRDNLQ